MTASYFKVCKTFGVKMFRCEVLIQNFRWYIVLVDSCVLIYLHCGAQEKIFCVCSPVSGFFMGIWYCTVYVAFCILCADFRRMDILVGVKVVPTNSQSDSVDFGTVWVHSANQIAVSDFAVWSYLLWLMKKTVLFNDITWGKKLGEPNRAMSFHWQVI